MIELYTAPTPNGWKVSVTLEELGIPYEVKRIDIMAGDQKQPEFLAINPNGRIPAIIDRDAGDLAIFESGAIMLYLAEKAGKLIPGDIKGRMDVIQWLMFQMSGIGPMQGQANVFNLYFPEKIPTVIDRYMNETKRLYTVLDKQLEGKDFICGDYSLADIANWGWICIHDWTGIEIDDLPNLKAWLERVGQRDAVVRGRNVPDAIDLSSISDDKRDQMQKSARTILQR